MNDLSITVLKNEIATCIVNIHVVLVNRIDKMRESERTRNARFSIYSMTARRPTTSLLPLQRVCVRLFLSCRLFFSRYGRRRLEFICTTAIAAKFVVAVIFQCMLLL
mmetsp:Transcript_34236/g.82438  ORF Transcript_34236/g.82438 Transcript_34236/m.82438 type:complete len:107 (+) Transcript_34236:1740-2060(+)